MADSTSSAGQAGNAAAAYGSMQGGRQTAVDRGRSASKLTIPGLIPDEGQNESATFSQPYQSLGARCVAHLSSALLLALFPPNLPFFRLNIDELVSEQLGEGLGEAQARLAVLTRTTHGLMEKSGVRTAATQCLRHLIVAGNVLLYTPEKDASRIYRIDQYVVKRDAAGRFTQIVVCEKVYPSTLDDSVRTATGLVETAEQEAQVDVYTVVQLVPGTDRMEWWQEIKNIEVPESRGSAPRDASPWHPLRWLAVPGSDYGRSQVTEYIGDLLSLEDLYKSMVQFAMAASRIIHIVDPNSGIDIEELASAETGDFLHGFKDRIQTLSLDKYGDWKTLVELSDRIEQRLAAAFLLTTAVTRNAERVTAEEIRLVAQELENVLGGTYTILAAEMQMPLVRRFLYLGQRANKVPALPETVTPTVVTGFDALGRAQGVNRIRAFIADLKEALGPEALAAVINPDELARRLGEGHGVDGLQDLLKSPEQQAEESQAAQQSAAIQAAVPNISKVAGEAALADTAQDQE